MRKNTRKCLSLLVAVALLVSTLPVAPVAAAQSSENVIPAGDETTQPALSDTNEPVEPAGAENYWDKNENGEWKIKPIPKDVIIVDENTKQWNNDKNGGWYIVQDDVTITNRIIVSKNVHLILTDNATLTAKAGIGVLSDKSLTIYTQSYGEDMGEILANTDDGFSFGKAGIGGDSTISGGTITINGGKITANGTEGAAGIGAGEGKDGGTVIINGGSVEATGGDNAAGIGGGFGGDGGTITISGGHVTANGGEAAAGIGGSNGGSGGKTVISGGTVIANGGTDGAGIGGGNAGDGGDITISGGDITATGGENGAGIGGGEGCNAGIITIDGGKVTAISTGYGAAIGNGESGDGGSITINRGEVIATSQNRGAGIGGSHSGDAGDITITGGIVEANGSVYGSGIGSGGNGGSGGKIIISGGTIIANGGEKDGDGIGSSPKGTFSTTDNGNANGNAVIIASSISDNDDSDWHGLIIQGSEGKLYGDNVVPSEAFTIPEGTIVTIIDEGQKLIIGDAITMTNEGTIINKGAPIEGAVRGNQPIRAATSLTLDSDALQLQQGATRALTANATPKPTEGEAPDSLIWSSSDDAIATVDEHGNVTAKGAGTATITAKATYGQTEATCTVTVAVESIPADSITIAPKELSMNVGENESLTATVTPDNATDQVIWSSNDKNVATVDQSGKVTAKAKGKATITATAGEAEAICKVTVEAEIPVECVELSATTLSLTEGEEHTLTATVHPANATDKTVTWESSEPSVATVDQNGKVTALSAGTATITATAGGKPATCEVTVKEKVIAVTGVTLDENNLDLNVGDDPHKLHATVHPENATNQEVTWSSSNLEVATVDNDGNVTAEGAGTAIITVTTVDGDFTDECTVNVTQPVSDVTLDLKSLTLSNGEEYQLAVTVLPKNATNKNVTWSSSDENIATVDQSGMVKAVSEGHARIIVQTENGGYTDECQITVTHTVSVTDVTLNKEMLELPEGKSEQLQAFVQPKDASNQNVKWSSSDEKIASVDQKGNVTAHKKGEAIITVTTEDGDKTATCTVTVTRAATEITLDKKTLELDLSHQKSAQLTANITPADAEDAIVWTSDDENIATVDAQGNVTAVGVGKATITTTAGGVSATCEVTVKRTATSLTLDKSELPLVVGLDDYLKAKVEPVDSTDDVRWMSSNDKVATVDEQGWVHAVSAGTATITAIAGKVEASCTVTVTPPVGSITLDKETLALNVGDSDTLIATITPDGAEKEVSWTSSDDTIATVDEHGKVTAVHSGTAIIMAAAGALSAECIVTVTQPATDISLDKSNLSLLIGDSSQLKATVTPADSTDDVRWSSNDKNVATVDQSGNVTAKAKGKATITARAGDKSATCTVTVTPPVESITLDKKALDLKVGESGTLKAAIEPDGAATDISWTSSAPAVAAVDAQGKVKALAPGKATITATVGGKSDTCIVTVSQPATGISLDKSKLTLAVGERSQLKAILKPANATDKVHWESSYQAVATVDENGWVTAHKKGTAVITAKVGGFSATCTVIVTPQATSIALDRDVLSLQVGERATLQATVQPPETTESVRWISSNEAVAMVDENGTVTAVGAGQAIITARAGKVEATCTVTVVGNSGGDLSVSVGASEHGYILLSPDDCYAVAGDRVTFTVMPDNGYKLKSVSVITADGKTVVLNNEGSGVYSFIMPEGKVTITVTFVKDSEAAVDNVFNDVSTNAWYLDNVQYVYDNGLMTGVDATHFAPEASMTRAMFVSVLARYAGDTTPAAPGEPWYEGARQWAIANGVSDGTLMDTSISREQLVTMLYRYAGAPQGTGDLSGFSDAGSVSIYAQDAMRWAVGEGIIGGMTADTLAPQSGATRAQVAAILQRFIEG